MAEMVDHPTHYKSADGSEVIDVIAKATEYLTGIEAFDVGNMIKYICRWKWKNGLEDVKKCRWYARHLYSHVYTKRNLTNKIPPADYIEFVHNSADSFTKNLNGAEYLNTHSILCDALMWMYDHQHSRLVRIINTCDGLINTQERKMN